MRLVLDTFTALVVTLAAPAMAQSVRMQIVDAAGAQVGTATAIRGGEFHAGQWQAFVRTDLGAARRAHFWKRYRCDHWKVSAVETMSCAD